MIILAVFSLLAAGVTPEVSMPDWQWKPDSPICTLRQESTSADLIEVARTPANEETQIEITSRPQRDVRTGDFHGGSIDLYPAGKASADGGFSRKGKRLVVHTITSDPSFIQQFSSASAIGVTSETAQQTQIAIRSAGLAVESLRACEDRKMRAWGIDPVAWRSLKSRPIPLTQVRDRFSALDYPEDALRAGFEFDAIIRLDVGPDGGVEQCRGLNPGGYRGFETASCAVLKAAKFQPARDTADNPVTAPIVFDVVFRIAS